jgi:hypothetical protein
VDVGESFDERPGAADRIFGFAHGEDRVTVGGDGVEGCRCGGR